MSTIFIIIFAEIFLLVSLLIINKLQQANKDYSKWFLILKVALIIAMVALILPIIFYTVVSFINI